MRFRHRNPEKKGERRGKKLICPELGGRERVKIVTKLVPDASFFGKMNEGPSSAAPAPGKG